MAENTETVTIRLPSGEEVDAVVPAGMSDQQVHDLMRQKHPDYFQPTSQSTPPVAAPPPSAGSRFWEGVKAGTGGENVLNTKLDPNHRFSTNAMIPGSGVYRDIKSGNLAGAMGRIAGPAAQLLPFAFGHVGEEPGVPQVVNAKTLAEPWTGERTGLPYQPNPRFQPAPEPAAPIPPRSGLLLKGNVEPPLGSVENPGIHSKIPLRVPKSVLDAERAPMLSPLGSPENPGPMAKLPMRIPRETLAREAEAQAKLGGAETHRDATLDRRNIPPFAGEGVEGENSPITSSDRLAQYGQPRPRGRMGPPLRPNVFASPEDAQIYDAQMSRLGAEAKDAGMYSAARGAVKRIPDYQERIGNKLRPFGPPEDLMEESTPPVRRKVENE